MGHICGASIPPRMGRTPCVVILNAVKNLLEADKRQPALIAHSKRGDPSLHSGWHIVDYMMIPYAVILNGVKNLEISVAVDGSASLEILRYTQDDIESERLPRLEEHSELSFHPSRCATARNHKITKSQNHKAWGCVISVIDVIAAYLRG